MPSDKKTAPTSRRMRIVAGGAFGLNKRFRMATSGILHQSPEVKVHLRQVPPTHHALLRAGKLCRFCQRGLYLALGLKPIVQLVTVCPSALLVKFVGTLLNLLLNRDQDGRLVRLRCECQWLFLDLVWMAIYFFSQLFSLPFQFVGFGTFGCHTYSLAC